MEKPLSKGVGIHTAYKGRYFATSFSFCVKFLSRRRCTTTSISHSSKDSWNDFEAHSLTVSFVVLVILDSAVPVVTVCSVHQKHCQEGYVEIWNCLQHIVQISLSNKCTWKLDTYIEVRHTTSGGLECGHPLGVFQCGPWERL